MESLSFDSCVRGHHVYQAIWSPVVGEMLSCQREFGNIMDLYAVSVVKDSQVVGHIPRKISAICNLFLRRGGLMMCQITGTRRFSADLEQGGLEVPCSLIFTGARKDIQKVKKLTLVVDTVNEPPTKKQKAGDGGIIDVDHYDSNGAGKVRDQPQPSIWVKVNGFMVTSSDKKELLDNRCNLNDRHITVAQMLISKQFPDTEGLACTLFQLKPVIKRISNGLQIIFDRGCHWILASCIECDSDTIEVYDSLYSDVTEASKAVILNLFDESRTKVELVSGVQKQNGVHDCGLFAIAFATSLLNGSDVRNKRFNQSSMRSHLHDCFNVGLLSPFP